MDYFNSNNKKFSFNPRAFKYLDRGWNGTVYHNDKVIFKQYYKEIAPSSRIDPKTFMILKDVRDKHFIKLYEPFSLTPIDSNNYQIDAYLAKLYQKSNINPLEEPIEFLLDNFSELEKLFNLFTNNYIGTTDVKFENSIITEDGIVILDPDLYRKKYIYGYIELSIHNKKMLLNLFKTLINSYRYEEGDSINGEVKRIKVDEDTSVTDEIKNIFSKVKRPIDYFNK